MSTLVSDRLRDNLARSLPLVRLNFDRIVDRMEVHLRGVDPDEAFGQSDVAAMMLVQLLLDSAPRLAEGRAPSVPAGLLAEHRALGIDSRHYSRFGDALVPILSDLLGAGTPREIPASWCDAFWAVIRSLQAPREALPA
jgi:hypothetical protein